MSRRRMISAFAAALLVGAAAGLLFGLLYARAAPAPITVTRPAEAWPAAYRCGVTVQPEDLDRCACDCSAVVDG